MLKSMTAYGRGAVERTEGRAVVEIQSVNRKYFDLNLSLPKEFASFEADVRKWIGSAVSRGQISIRINASFNAILPVKIRPNIALAKEVKSAWDQIADELSVDPKQFQLSLLSQEHDLFAYDENLLEKMHCLELIKEAFDEALRKFLEMKEVEGAAIEADLSKRVKNLENLIKEIVPIIPETVSRYREKLIKRLQEIFTKEGLSLPIEVDQRLLQEVALFAEKIDVEEELTRLQSHCEQIKTLLKKREAVGKTFEFLLQELTREANTLTAKSQDLRIVRVGLEIKGEIEKIREQIQNVE